jgi:hypothetical protein
MSHQVSSNMLLQALNDLPIKYKEEAMNFIEFLRYKYKTEKKLKQNIMEKEKRKFGYFPKGTFVLSEDFDAPLDCFKDYLR